MFQISMAAILHFCTFVCVEVFDFIEFFILGNLCVDTRMNLLGAFKIKL